MAQYFDSPHVEWLTIKYHWTGCTDIKLRDEILTHLPSLARQLIRKNNLDQLGNINNLDDLISVSYIQIEKTLYKFRSEIICRACKTKLPIETYPTPTLEEIVEQCPACPKCHKILTSSPLVPGGKGVHGGSDTIAYRAISKIFNMWSQICRQVCLSVVKHDNADLRNRKSFIVRKEKESSLKRRAEVYDYKKFLIQAKELIKLQGEDFHKIVEFLESFDPHEYNTGMIKTISDGAGVPRASVQAFLKYIRLQQDQFDCGGNPSMAQSKKPAPSPNDDG